MIKVLCRGAQAGAEVIRAKQGGGRCTIILDMQTTVETKTRARADWRRSARRAASVVALCAAAAFFAQSAVSLPGVARRPATHTPAQKRTRPDVARFSQRVAAILGGEHAKQAYWGILVTDRQTGETLYELNPERYFALASNTKLFTSALALEALGRDYRFHTTLESSEALDADGRVKGDLRLVGRGDPDLSNRKFPYAGRPEREGPAEKVLVELADAGVRSGLREVDGDIVADDSYLPYDPYPAGWSAGDLFFSFGAPVSAIAFNENVVSIEVQAGTRVGEAAKVTAKPEAALAALAQEVTTGPAGGQPELAVVRRPGQDFVLLRGTVPLGEVHTRIELAMTAPAEAAARALRQLLEERGVRVKGGTRVEHAPPPETSASGEPILSHIAAPPDPKDAIVIAEHISPPLIESIRVANKVSQNIHAELFLRAVGREKLGMGSTAAGLKVERGFLERAGIGEDEVVLTDGSGLSRGNLVTPRAVVTLLRYAARQPWGRDYLSILPVAGVDGTLEDRMKNTAAAGRIEAKTGSVEHVHALSGYATTVANEQLAFAIFCNNDVERGPNATAAIDAIATAMVETLGGRQARKNQ